MTAAICIAIFVAAVILYIVGLELTVTAHWTISITVHAVTFALIGLVGWLARGVS